MIEICGVTMLDPESNETLNQKVGHTHPIPLSIPSLQETYTPSAHLSQKIIVISQIRQAPRNARDRDHLNGLSSVEIASTSCFPPPPLTPASAFTRRTFATQLGNVKNDNAEGN